MQFVVSQAHRRLEKYSQALRCPANSFTVRPPSWTWTSQVSALVFGVLAVLLDGDACHIRERRTCLTRTRI